MSIENTSVNDYYNLLLQKRYRFKIMMNDEHKIAVYAKYEKKITH